MMQPVEEIAARAAGLLQGFSPAEHLPMLAVHVRRTDKAKDADISYYYKVTNTRTNATDTLGRFSELIFELELRTGAAFKSFFLAADDARYYTPDVVDKFKSFFKRGSSVRAFLGDTKPRAAEKDCPTHSAGNHHCVADHEAVAASVLAAAKHSSYVVGMGGSGGECANAPRPCFFVGKVRARALCLCLCVAVMDVVGCRREPAPIDTCKAARTADSPVPSARPPRQGVCSVGALATAGR